MTRIVGIGAGGHARVVLEILQARDDVQIAGLLDADESLWGTAVLGIPVLGGDALLPGLLEQGVTHAFIGVGSVSDTAPRRALYEMARSAGLEVLSVVHPASVVSPTAVLGEGATILAGAVVGTGARLGADVIVNSGAIVEHDCVIGDHVHIATGAALASTVRVEDGVHVGVGASVRQCLTLGARSVIGAGAAVVRDVEAGTVVGGVPARPLEGEDS